MKKVLHLNTNLEVTSGVTRYIELLCKNLSKNFEHHVITFCGNADKDLALDAPTNVYQIRASVLVSKIITPYVVWRYIKRNGINIVHSHHRYMDFIASIVSRICDIKTITTVHSKVYGMKSMSYKSSALIAVSKSINDHLVNYFGVSDNRIKLINNFVDKEFLFCKKNRNDMRLQLGIGPDEFLLGYVGRINLYEKGIDLLVNTFEILKRKHSNLRLILIGSGYDIDTIKKIDNKKNLKIIWISQTSNVFEYFQCIDLFVLPSRIDPFPYVMLEAAELMIPIVAANVDGIPEFIEDGISGLLFEKESLNDLVKKTEQMLGSKYDMEEYAKRLFAKVTNQYHKDKVLSELTNLYNDN